MLDEVLDVLCEMGCRSAEPSQADDDHAHGDESPLDPVWFEVEIGGEG